MSRELLKQCLSKFEHLWEIGIDAHYRVDLIPDIRALRQALAEPQAVQVRPAEFVATATIGADAGVGVSLIGTPVIWAEWPTRPEEANHD